MQRLPQTSTHSLCLPTGEPSLSRESGGVGPRCACFPALNWTAETRAAAGGTAVTDIPHYCCCKCQSTTRNQSRLHWTHGQTQIYFMGRGVNRCVSMAMVCGGEGFSFLLMWQQVFFFFSQNLQQVTAWLTQAQTFFRFISALPGSFQPRSSPGTWWYIQYTTRSLFPPQTSKSRSRRLSHRQQVTLRSLQTRKCMITQAQAREGKEIYFQTFVTSDLTDHSLSQEAGVLHHQLIGLIIHPLVTTSCCHSHSNYAGPQSLGKL